MQYTLLIIDDESVVTATPPAEIEAILERHGKFADELRAAGAWISSHRLRPSAETATVRRSGGEVAVVDGPFAESKEVLGGLYLIEAASMKEAIAWAKKLPVLPGAVVEVRQVWGTTKTTGRWREA